MAHDTVLLIPDDEAGGFTVRVPAIPAIVTEGNDRAHALAMAREAIESYLEAAVEHGWEIPRASAPAEIATVDVAAARATEVLGA